MVQRVNWPAAFAVLVFFCSAAALSRAQRNSTAVTYTEITQSSGIQFKNQNSATSEKYLIETMTGGVAIFDYDNDGWPDVFLVNGARIRAGQPDSEAPNKTAPEFWVLAGRIAGPATLSTRKGFARPRKRTE